MLILVALVLPSPVPPLLQLLVLWLGFLTLQNLFVVFVLTSCSQSQLKTLCRMFFVLLKQFNQTCLCGG